MRLAVLVVLVLAFLWGSTAAQAALSFLLHSHDFPPPPDPKLPLRDYVAYNPLNTICMLVALDNGLGGVVRFVYSSNVTDVRQRADVLVSIHKPQSSAPSIAVLDTAENVVDTKVFTAAELHRVNVEANVARRSKERQGDSENIEEEELARSFTLTMRPAQEGTGAGAHFLDGNYAACFRLLRAAGSAAAAKSGSQPVPEEVQIRLLEVASTRHSTSTYIARLNKATGNDAAANSITSEADREYAKMIRMMFRASKNADLQKLLNSNEVVTSQQTQQQLDALKAVQQQLFAMYSTSEHLEERYARMRVTAETTFTRIWVCMIATVSVMGATIWLTFYFTKDIIVKRKLL
jgi:hypothetical protein